MDRLSVELISIVCSFLKPSEVGQFRCVSKFYANVGRPFMFRRFHLIFTPDSFERLHAICSNPTLANYVTSLYYEADTLQHYYSFDQWQRHSDHPLVFSGLDFTFSSCPDHSSERALRAYRRELMKQKTTAYQKYLDYSMQQDAMCEADYHAGKITDAIAHLPNLKEIVLSLDYWVGEPSKAMKNAYNDSLIIPYGDNGRTEPRGVPQMLSLLQGSALTQTKLKSLCAGVVDWRLFDQSDEVFEDLQKAVRNLQELRMKFSTKPPIRGGEGLTGNTRNKLEIISCALYLRNGRLREFLAAAPDLKLLDLRFDRRIKKSIPCCPADLRYVVGKDKWEFLADLTLSVFNSREEDLIEFCETHAMTLQRLVINEIQLAEGSWLSTFQRMRRLLHLKKARVCGNMEAFEISNEYWNFPPMTARDETTMSRVVQDYLLQGGDGPLLDLAQYDHLNRFELAELNFLM